MSEQVTSKYRIIGFADGDRRMLMYDIVHNVAVWASMRGYDGPLHDQLTELEAGNVIEATMTGEPAANEPWDFEAVSMMQDTTLDFVQGVDEIPGPTDEAWDERGIDNDVGVRIFRDDDTEEPIGVVQVHPPTYEGDNVWDNMRRGQLPLEPWYDEMAGLDEGAHHIVVVNPETRPYIVMYGFPEDVEVFHDLRAKLFHEIQDAEGEQQTA